MSNIHESATAHYAKAEAVASQLGLTELVLSLGNLSSLVKADEAVRVGSDIVAETDSVEAIYLAGAAVTAEFRAVGATIGSEHANLARDVTRHTGRVLSS